MTDLTREQLQTVNREVSDHLANATDDCIVLMRRANQAEAKLTEIRDMVTMGDFDSVNAMKVAVLAVIGGR